MLWGWGRGKQGGQWRPESAPGPKTPKCGGGGEGGRGAKIKILKECIHECMKTTYLFFLYIQSFYKHLFSTSNVQGLDACL